MAEFPLRSMDNLVTANIRARPIRSLVSIAGVALGVILVLLFTGLSRGMSNDLQRRSSNVRAEILFTRKGSMDGLTGSSPNLNVEYANRLRQVEGVASAIPVILYISPGSGFGFQQIEGVDWDAFSAMNQMTLVSGRAPTGMNEVVIDQTKANNDHLRPGSEIKLFGNKPYTVVGVYSPESGPRVKMSLAAMQAALEVTDRCTYILVKCKNAAEQEIVAQRINDVFQGNVKIQYTRDVFTSVEKSLPALRTFLRVLVGLAAIVSTLVIMLAMYTTITERTREIGILKALGASRWYIISEIEKEALLISALGLLVGFAVSMLAGVVIHRLYGLIFEFSWGWILTAGLIGLFGALVGALYPAIRAANLDPVNALSYD